jgi:hypothetical protein
MKGRCSNYKHVRHQVHTVGRVKCVLSSIFNSPSPSPSIPLSLSPSLLLSIPLSIYPPSTLSLPICISISSLSLSLSLSSSPLSLSPLFEPCPSLLSTFMFSLSTPSLPPSSLSVYTLSLFVVIPLWTFSLSLNSQTILTLKLQQQINTRF